VMRHQQSHGRLNDKAEVNADMSQLCLRMGDMDEAEMYAQESISVATAQVARLSVSSGTTGADSTSMTPTSSALAGRARQLAESSLVMSRVFQAKQRCAFTSHFSRK
jgi:hypothetical protein